MEPKNKHLLLYNIKLPFNSIGDDSSMCIDRWTFILNKIIFTLKMKLVYKTKFKRRRQNYNGLKITLNNLKYLNAN